MRSLYYLAPLITHVLFLPILSFEKFSSITSLIEMILGAIVIPIYLIIVSSIYIPKITFGKFIKYLLFMLAISIVGICVAYFNWGVLTGDFFKPDSETVLLTQIQIQISSIIIFVGWIISCIIKKTIMYFKLKKES